MKKKIEPIKWNKRCRIEEEYDYYGFQLFSGICILLILIALLGTTIWRYFNG